MRMSTESVSSEQGVVAEPCEHGNQPSDFINGGEFFD
jgi:hypothetical protein